MSVVFFFFKQKTAYEMRISDWSSDVCSSDLDSVLRAVFLGGDVQRFQQVALDPAADTGDTVGHHHVERVDLGGDDVELDRIRRLHHHHAVVQRLGIEIGRASCRERVCQYV